MVSLGFLAILLYYYNSVNYIWYQTIKKKNITDKILLALKFELIQKYLANKIQYC